MSMASTSDVISSCGVIVSTSVLAYMLWQHVARNRREVALDAWRRWHSPDMRESRSVWSILRENYEDKSHRITLNGFDKNRRRELATVLHFFEDLANLIDSREVDKKLVRCLFERQLGMSWIPFLTHPVWGLDPDGDHWSNKEIHRLKKIFKDEPKVNCNWERDKESREGLVQKG